MKTCENCGREPECYYKITLDYKGCKYWVGIEEFNRIKEEMEEQKNK